VKICIQKSLNFRRHLCRISKIPNTPEVFINFSNYNSTESSKRIDKSLNVRGKCDESTCQCGNKAALATTGRTIQKVSPSVRDSTRRVPLRAVDEIVDVVEQTFGETGTENHGCERAATARMPELSPLGAGRREHDRLAFLPRQRGLPRAVQDVRVQLVLTAERGQRDRLPRYSGTQVQHLLLSVPLHPDPVLLVAEEVYSGAWNELKLGHGFSVIHLKPNVSTL